MGRLTNGIILSNVLVFILIFSLPESLMEYAFSILSFSGPQVLEIWRWFTSIFLHASASHLFFNMLGLYFFGKNLEKEIKPGMWLLIYLVSGIAGNIIFGLTSANPVVGASGCIFGLMGAAMLMKPKQTVKLFVFPLPLGIVAIMYAIVESMLVYFSPLATVDNVAHVAHVAGFAIGALIIFFTETKKSLKSLPWLALFLVILILLGPIFGLIIGIGNFLLGIVDVIVGFFLYGLAYLLSLFWGIF